MTRKGRRLSAEEERLWQQIAKSTNPLESTSQLQLSAKPALKIAPEAKAAPIKPFKIGERSKGPSTETRMVAAPQPLNMDRKTFARMKRGKSSPEARIDLHGMTVDIAHSALLAFLLRSHAEGKRLVLVITGKGQTDDHLGATEVRRGVLRRQVPHWLEQPPLRQIVLQTTTAHQKHGGSGALYVYLRR